MNQNEADRAIGSVYEAALRPETWPDALGAIARAFNASGATAQMVGSDGFLMLTSPSYDGIFDEFIRQGWHLNNRRMERGLALTRAGHRGFATEYHMFSPDELARDPYEQEFARHCDTDAEAGILLATHEGLSFVLTAPRSLRVGSYSRGELALMNEAANRIAAATSFALRLKLAAAADMLGTLGARGEALALLTPRGRVLCANAAFEQLLNGGLIWRNGGCHARDGDEERALQALIQRAATWTPDSGDRLVPVVLGRASDRPLVARCLPVAGAARDFLGLARIVLAVDEVRQPSRAGAAEVLAAAFGLTPAEARLAERLGNGDTLREAADTLEITYETARTRLKTVFRKTGASRQSELILLVDRLSRS